MQVFIEPFNFSFFRITGWGIDLDYCDVEWFALETNRDHSVIFEIASKCCISDSFVDHDGYSMFKVRRDGREKVPLIQGKEQWLCFAGAAVKRYPKYKVRENQVRFLREAVRGQTH